MSDDLKDLVDDIDQIMTQQEKSNRYVARVHDYLRRNIMQLPLFRLGLTGGFATGKSSVAAIFEELGCPIVNADHIVHDLLANDQKVKEDIRFLLGDDVFNTDGSVNRSKVGARVFANPEELRGLEAILHPKVKDIMMQEANRLEQEGYSIACFEIPLLFEASYEHWCDSVVVVTCDEETQIQRAMQKFKLSREDAAARIQAQMPLTEKEKRADVVISNTSPLENLKSQVEAIYTQLLPQT
ncbi:MAG: dephospho-CoA kinase [Deltaproteobacteria bacterium CG11_big_fil_rev_8_21_14_0_20_47_16]|nr:MAG: dephospho-CoA kinase [Deltaproteobacteria bacterium CG11_big_fil_rev_8_21_14_0_20_47_16]